eukprot:m.38885 g.38885  ORF g.38885 m.38885 type:complete len:150 (-) comp11536_c0_seq4:147-596(-)
MLPTTAKGATSSFNSTARRTEPLFKRDTFLTPGPNVYQKEEDTIGLTLKSGEQQGVAAFGIRVDRFADPGCDLNVPPVTKYQVTDSVSPSKSIQSVFKSRVKRVALPSQPSLNTPSPNAYDPYISPKPCQYTLIYFTHMYAISSSFVLL